MTSLLMCGVEAINFNKTYLPNNHNKGKCTMHYCNVFKAIILLYRCVYHCTLQTI